MILHASAPKSPEGDFVVERDPYIPKSPKGDFVGDIIFTEIKLDLLIGGE
jgi:hypothetical protein